MILAIQPLIAQELDVNASFIKKTYSAEYEATLKKHALQEWSIDGYKESNITKVKSFEVFSLENLLKLHCDWTMVKYEYDKQVKAKNAF